MDSERVHQLNILINECNRIKDTVGSVVEGVETLVSGGFLTDMHADTMRAIMTQLVRSSGYRDVSEVIINATLERDEIWKKNRKLESQVRLNPVLMVYGVENKRPST